MAPTDTADVRYTPPRPTLLAVAILSAWVVILCLPMLAGYFLGGPNSDQTYSGLAVRMFWASEFHRTGHIPLWDPYMFGGLPFVAAMHGDIFYPTSFLRLLFSADHVLDIVFALHLILAGVLTYAFLRTIGVSWIASVTGGLAYQLSGIVASLVQPGHDGKMIVSALLPALLTGLVIGIRRRRLEGFALVALIVGLDLLSPHVQLTQYSLILAGLFTLWLCFGDDQRPASVSERWSSLGLAALAVVVGFGISMIQLLPFLGYRPYGARSVGAQGWAYATSYPMPPAHLMDWLVPTFTGVLGKYWGSNPIKFHSEYVGAATLALAAVGVASAARRRLIWFLGGALLLFVLVCLGANTPFYRLWYAVVPGVKLTRAPGMAFFIPTFIFACFAAFGVERIERGEGAKLVRGVLIGAGVLLLLGASGALGALATTLASARAQAAEQNAGAIAGGAILSAIVAAAAGAIALAALKGKLKPGAMAALLIVVLGGDLFINARRYFTFSSPRQIFSEDEVTRTLEAAPKPYRVLDLPDNNGAYPLAFLMEKRIPNAFGYHGNELHAYDELWGGKGRWTNVGTTRLWNLLALRYVILPVPTRVAGYHQIAGATMPAGGAATEAVLYEADTLPPYARVVPAAAKVPEDRIVPTLMDPRLDYNRVVLLPPDAPITTMPMDSLPPTMAARAAVTAWEPGAMTVRLDPAPEHDAFLVVSENWYPDWRATVDGRGAPVLRGQQTLLTVQVPRGAREVRLWFTSASYRTGKAITLASLGIAMLWLGIPLALRRRRA